MTKLARGQFPPVSVVKAPPAPARLDYRGKERDKEATLQEDKGEYSKMPTHSRLSFRRHLGEQEFSLTSEKISP